MEPVLRTRQTPGAEVQEVAPGRWRMAIPAGPSGEYRWAQLDDHLHQARSTFPWRPPLRLELRARVSAADLPGTWGFGFWNDPFSASFGVSGAARRLPALPSAAWFFFAGRPNYLSFRDRKPAQGFLAASFASLRLPAVALAPFAVGLPLLALPPAARLLRRASRLLIKEDSALVSSDPTGWRAYRLDWYPDRLYYFVDGQEIFTSSVAPRGPLGLVIWIDNQYAAFPPDGKIRMGTSQNPQPAWFEVENVDVTPIKTASRNTD